MSSSGAPSRPSPVLVAVPLAVVLGSFAIVVKLLAAPVTNTDTYFHIRMGREFLDGWSTTDPGTVTRFASADWLPSQWLGQVAYGAFDQWFGLPGVAWLAGAGVLLFALTIFWTARSEGSLVVATLVVPVTILACAPWLSGRPQVVSYLFATLVTAAWLKTRRTGRVAWWIIPLTWVWAMFHGMWSVSVIISVVAIAGLLLERNPERPGLAKMCAVPVLSLAVAALTPVGPGLYATVLRVGSINHYFSEWGPTDFTHPSIAVAALAMVLLLVLGLRSGPVAWGTLVLVLLAGAWILYSNRTVPVGAAMLAPLLAAELAGHLPSRSRSRIETPVVLAGLLVALGALALAVPHTSDQGAFHDNKAHASVSRLPAGTALLNEWNEGGYDMWAHPDLDIVMHGYGDMYTDDEIKRNDELGDLEPGWDEVVRDLDVREALLYADSKLAYALEEQFGWIVVVKDDNLAHLRAPADWSSDAGRD